MAGDGGASTPPSGAWSLDLDVAGINLADVLGANAGEAAGAGGVASGSAGKKKKKSKGISILSTANHRRYIS
jgi:hypothetical protein